MTDQDSGLVIREDKPRRAVGEPGNVCGCVTEERIVGSDQPAIEFTSGRFDKGKYEAFGE